MEEKIIIKSEQYNTKGISLGLVAVGVVLFVLVGLPAARNISTSSYSGFRMSYFLTSALPYYAALTILPFAVIGGVFHWCMSKISLTISDKRAFGTAFFGQRVDLPLDMISAVKTVRLWKGITVATSSGSIRFAMIKNVDQIYSAIGKLLVERQGRSAAAASAPVQAVPGSGAEELKKYKELLDSGAITQEEFEAKKKQILGM